MLSRIETIVFQILLKSNKTDLTNELDESALSNSFVYKHKLVNFLSNSCQVNNSR